MHLHLHHFPADNGAGLLIWWTTEADAERVASLVHDKVIQLPGYILAELDLKASNAGLLDPGRLWVPAIPETEGLESIPWEGPACDLADQAGGIVFKATDVPILAGLPGFITTLEMEFWQPSSLVLHGLLASLHATFSRGPEEPQERFAARLASLVIADMANLLAAVEWRARPSWWVLVENAAKSAAKVASNEEAVYWQVVKGLNAPAFRFALAMLATDLALIAGQEWEDE